MRAWSTMFTELFTARDVTPPYSEQDYFQHLDGRPRYEGVASLLESRGFGVPWGDPSDPDEAETVCGIGNRKNAVFSALLEEEGIAAYPGSLAVLDRLGVLGIPVAIVSSSKNAVAVLTARPPHRPLPSPSSTGSSPSRRGSRASRSRTSSSPAPLASRSIRRRPSSSRTRSPA